MIIIINLQSADVKLAKIIYVSQISMSCPSDSSSHKVELLGDITVPSYLYQLEMFKYHCCQNRKRGLNFLIMTSWRWPNYVDCISLDLLIFSNQENKQKPNKKTEAHPAVQWTKPCTWSDTNLFSLQGRYWVPEAVKAVFYVVPTLALQCIVVCPFVCLQ